MDNGANCYRRFIKGDDSGLEDIVSMYGNNLMFFINGYVKNTELAEDLMEDTFMELIIHKHYFRGESSFKTYLFKIGRNKALNAIKKNRSFSLLDNDIEDTKRLEDDVIKSEKNKMIKKAMAKLKEEYSVVLHLIYFEELSYDQIGKIMGKTNKQIKNLAYRARISLKEVLEKEGFSYED